MLKITQPTVTGGSDWNDWADDVLRGKALGPDRARAIIGAPDHQLLELLAAAYRIRYAHFGNTVQLYYLINAKSGLCPEDCGYCSQSKVATSAIPRYNLLSPDNLLAGAQAAWERQSKTYCIVISGRGPSEREMQAIVDIVPQIKEQFPLKICVCLGLLNETQAQRLKSCGVDRVNHNLNTGPAHYESICSTHTYQDRLATLRAVRQAGLEVCSGGIIGMRERPEDIVDMAMELQSLHAESIPINFLHAIDGTPLANTHELNPRYCLKVLCMFRFVNPKSELRIAGGRELHLRSMQAMGLYPANSIFVGDYLTTKGQLPAADYAMIEDLGFEITRVGEANAEIDTEPGISIESKSSVCGES